MNDERVLTQAVAVKDTYTRERAPEDVVPSATACTSSTSIKDTVSPMSLSNVLFGLATHRDSEAWRCL